jgi:hypothetical protein
MGIRISEMEEATTFGADDYVPIVTNGTNKKALGAKIKDFIAGFFATKNGDNITDDSAFRTAIGINAANTPFVNTGTGMTAEDVQAGIEELNTSKANISGDNIADKATFRTNVELCPKIKAKQITGTTDHQGRLLSTGWNIANVYILGILSGGHGQIALQLRLSNNNFAVKFIDSSGMSVIANTVVSCMVYYIEPD